MYFTAWKDTVSLEQVQASLVWNDTQRRPWMMVGTRLLKLFKVGIVEENWKEDLRETTGSNPVMEARVHSATSARPSCSKFVVEDFEGFAEGGAMRFAGDEMVLKEEKCGEFCLARWVAENGCVDEFPAVAHALAVTESEQDQRG
ncbi:hypothetical protein ACFX10_025324 [Malus domestica]